MATSKMQFHEIVEFPINTGQYNPAHFEAGAARSWPGVIWKYVHRYAEELRGYYRAKYGRGNYRVKIEKRRCELSGRHIARIVVLGP